MPRPETKLPIRQGTPYSKDQGSTHPDGPIAMSYNVPAIVSDCVEDKAEFHGDRTNGDRGGISSQPSRSLEMNEVASMSINDENDFDQGRPDGDEHEFDYDGSDEGFDEDDLDESEFGGPMEGGGEEDL
ncbi:hypothetical protein BU26DRAFT_100883 [Trematosphaeria pertusa]|uniref:Uncharacterized protein n=1 Tax=Trematosphaeria pertusa TaxID=390896 RepID=A0A6A6I1R6_9PLEO|nr:uncharacterized protein BU26DRAFT_100883 [Trematosphaeria pertusa]KAF2244405.1 hypothetical protein BU26DRAFT_100883 [Trematosphaeria pertusa]